MSTYNKFASSAFGGGTGSAATNDKINVYPYGMATTEVIGNAIFRNDVIVLGNIINSGVTGPTGSVNFNNLNITDNLTVGGTLGVTGPTTLYSTLDVAGPVGLTNNVHIGGTFGVTGATNLTYLTATNNTNIGGTLGVTGDTHLTNLEVSGYATVNSTLDINGMTTMNDNVKLSNPVGTIDIGSNVGPITLTNNVTGTTSAVTSGTAFIPNTLIVNAGCPYDYINVFIPIDLFGGHTTLTNNSTFTLTYSGVAMNIYKNGVLQSPTYNSITEVGLSPGTTKTAHVSPGWNSYWFAMYFGYFDCRFPIEKYSSTINTYDIELIVTGTVTNNIYSTNLYFSVASVAGKMGYPTVQVDFTTTRNAINNSYTTWTGTIPTYVIPYYDTDYSANIISSTTDLKIQSSYDMTMEAVNSFKFNANNGYWTATSFGNFYYNTNTPTESVNLLLGEDGGAGRMAITASPTTCQISTESLPLDILTYSGRFLVVSGDISLTGSGTFNISAGTTLGIGAGTSIAMSAGTNYNIGLTTTGTGDITLTSADTLTMSATNGITSTGAFNCNGDFKLQQTTLSSMSSNQLGYTNVSSGTSTAMTSGTWKDMFSTSIPAGAWIVSFTITTSTTGGAGTVGDIRFLLSTTNVAGGNTPYRTFKWFRAADDSVSANGDRDWISLTGVVNNTASTSYYVQGLANLSGISMTAIVNTFTYTRIG